MRQKTRKSKGAARAVTRKIIIGVEVLVLLLTTIGGYAWSKVSKINTVDISTDEIVINDEVDMELLSGFTNIALFGIDSRDGLLESGSNSDTMIVVSINNDTGEINMVSLYRDTYMDLGYGGYAKANAAYSYGGPQQALSMLNKSMDLDITKFIATDFKALAVAIDAMGGLDVDMTSEEVVWMNGYVIETALASDMLDRAQQNNSDHEEIYDGVHHLDGLQCTAFCRIRYTDGNDYKRTERQRYIISLMFEKAKTMDFADLSKIVDQVFPMVYTNVTLSELVKIGMSIMTYSMNESIGVPDGKVTGFVGNNGDCVVPTNWTNDVITVHQKLFGDMNYSPSSTVTSIANYIASCEVLDHDPNKDSGESTESTGEYYNGGEEYYDDGGGDYGGDDGGGDYGGDDYGDPGEGDV